MKKLLFLALVRIGVLIFAGNGFAEPEGYRSAGGLMPGLSSASVTPTQRQPDDRAENLGLQRFVLGDSADAARAAGHPSCRKGDRGRLIRYERVASHPTAASVRAYFDDWIAFYQDFYLFPPDVPVTFNYGFDSYKVTYCTVDAVLPGQSNSSMRSTYASFP